MIRTLITSFGTNTSIGVAKALKNKDIVIYATDINHSYQCNGFAFADFYSKIPYYYSESFKDTLIDLINKNEIDCVIPIHDREIEIISELSIQYPELTKWAVNKPELIQLCNNKKKINEKLEAIVTVPKTFNEHDAIKFPIIVKPLNGVSSNGIKIINSQAEMKNDYWSSNNIIQKFVKGKEYTIDCYTSYSDKEIFCYSVRERIETKAGMSVKARIVDNQKLGELCKSIHNYIGYKGVSNIQFIEADDNYFFIELNPRFAGGGILTYKSGLNMPIFTVYELMKQDVKCLIDNKYLRIGNQMVRYFEETFFDYENNIIRSR